ncbi:MAG TPA: SAM-dependent methyltransferase [Rugosimonospora sp.]|nr:SAM-dependent methyltransferase [Rugosimonospora sp.]
MRRYALLVAASSNRVYAAAAPDLALAELTVFGRALATPPGDAAVTAIAGLPYVTFTGDLAAVEVDLLANLSAAYGLFELVGDDLLRPVPLRPLARFDDDLITIPKYAGKTNEQFTKLLLNVTVLAARPGLAEPLVVLDPLAGRGSTLNQALVYGYSGIGIEIDGKDVDAYSAFLRAYLQRKKIKHRTDFAPVRRDRRQVARRFEASVGDQSVVLYHGDTTAARDYLRASCADVLVADAPYGVAHGAHAGGALARNPVALLRAALPVWRQLLRPGGALGLAWNTRVAPRAEVAKLLADNGFAVVDGPGYDALEHRVDQSIQRDVIVARN